MRTADEIRKTAKAWAELREWARNESDEGLNIKRRDDKGQPDYWVFLGTEGEWEEQVEFARDVAKTFGLPLIIVTWDEDNEDVEVVDYDPPSRARAIAEAVGPWKERAENRAHIIKRAAELICDDCRDKCDGFPDDCSGECKLFQARQELNRILLPVCTDCQKLWDEMPEGTWADESPLCDECAAARALLAGEKPGQPAPCATCNDDANYCDNKHCNAFKRNQFWQPYGPCPWTTCPFRQPCPSCAKPGDGRRS